MRERESDTRGGEKPGRREAVERFAAKCVREQGMDPRKARKLAEKHAKRVERGATRGR